MNAWIDQVADALDYMEWIGSVASDWPSIEENVGLLASAARLVLEGEDIWWCRAHKSVGNGCDKASAMFAMSGSAGDCRMVLRRMIDIPEGAGT